MNQESKTKPANGSNESKYAPAASKITKPTSALPPDKSSKQAPDSSPIDTEALTGAPNDPVRNDPALNRELLQSIDSHFYNVSDPEGSPIASLIVLVDSKRRPVRAELHLNDVSTDEGGRQAVRQAQHIIEDRYAGPDAIPMQVWQSFLRSDHPLPVQLNPDASKIVQNSTITASAGVPVKPLIYLAAAIVLLALIWTAWNWAMPNVTPAANEPGSGGIGIPIEPSTDGGLTDETLAPVGDNPAPAVNTSLDGDLPVSTNAPVNISLGKRVRMVTGLSQSVRSEAGANAGAEVGTLTDQAEALIVGGPTMLAGNADTIVWWEVRYDDDITGWVAANNSDRALLEALE